MNDTSIDKFINRELSWIEFNKRVLDIGKDKAVPLMERIKFLSIVSSNFDEFFMIRVGTLHDQLDAGVVTKDSSGLSPAEQIDEIQKRAYEIEKDKYRTYNSIVRKDLKDHGILFMDMKSLTGDDRKYVDEYYTNTVFPVLTPIVVQNTATFPLVANKSLNIGMIIENDEGERRFATVQVPSVLSRLVELPKSGASRRFVFLEDIIRDNLPRLFNGHAIQLSSYYRVTRNADLTLDEEGAEDLLETIEASIKQRKWGAIIRLEVDENVSDDLLSVYDEFFEIPDNYVFRTDGPLDLTFLMKLSSMEGYDELRHEPIVPRTPQSLRGDIFEAISKSDIILHHPYDSFDPVVSLVRSAADDPKVLAIKQTLYRVSGKSPIVEALIRAAENGKQVTVLVELKARFDEENNILWAKRLEKAGCHVIYGIVGLKTHCKALLVVRMEDSGIKRYVHLGTGNYNDITAKLYTDLSLMTCNLRMGSDASMLFNMLSGNSKIEEMHKLYVSPINLRDKIVSLIDREIKHASSGHKAHILIKINSLVDDEIIEKLYEASCSGVKVDLIVRGICALRPGIRGLSENIRVISIVGRFLEHSRVFYFYNNSDDEIYLSSADLMRRNLDRRVELLFPVEDSKCKSRVKKIIDAALRDNVRAKYLMTDGKYRKSTKKTAQFDFQDEMLKNSFSKSQKKVEKIKEFKPIMKE